MHHIIDPATGAPVRATWRTASVAAANCADANIATTAALVRGQAAPSWLAGLGLPARLVNWDGNVTVLGSWPAEVSIHADGGDVVAQQRIAVERWPLEPAEPMERVPAG